MLKEDPERAISLIAVRSLLFQRGRCLIGGDMNKIHGTAVWCLQSDMTTEVEYHIDYAELYRYENNIIYPPIYAGTCHLSPLQDGDITGGDFMVNTNGLEHYRKFGYKGIKTITFMNKLSLFLNIYIFLGRLTSKEELENDIKNSCDWTTIKYKSNRSILHDGNFPHLSTKIQSINPLYKRVILGFNCFSNEISECNLRAPEHSQAFNRTVKLYQMMSNARKQDHIDESKGKSSNESNKTKITAKEILKNPKLAKLLILAAKKVKQHENENLMNIK